MEIQIENNSIVLRFNPGYLKGYQLSQLRFYGYQPNKNIYSLNTKAIDKELVRIISYFDKEDINYDISSQAKFKLNQIRENNLEREKLFSIGSSIKAGEFSESDFRNFSKYLNSNPRKLRDHQVKAAFHLYKLKNAANFSVPGSGKTSVVITVYEKLRLEGKCNMIFVVGPPSSFQPWQNEFEETLGRKVETTILSGGDKELREEEYYKSGEELSELYLSTFQTAMNDYLKIIKLIGQNEVNCYFVIDEAHYIKQLGGSWAKSLLEISSFARFRCILTGTPIPKSYTDLFNLFDFLWGNDGPLSNEDRIHIQLAEKKGENERVKKILDSRIGPLFYRVRKKDLGLKPPIFHEPIKIKMNKYEKEIYKLIVSKVHELSQNEFLNNQTTLEKLWKGRMMRLRQCVSYPKLLLSSIENYKENLFNEELISKIVEYDDNEIPSKLEYLLEKVKYLNSKNLKVLIWSNFIGTLELIKSHLLQEGLNCEIIYGKTPTKKSSPDELAEEMTREEIRDVFVDSDSGLDILIANPAACAESISLHKTCFHAFYYDMSYNCAQYLQSLDRIHRVGGSETNTANYYFLQYDNTIDLDIKSNLDRKAEKMYGIVDEEYEIYNLDMFEESADDDLATYKRVFKPKQIEI